MSQEMNGSSAVVLAEYRLMEDALNRVVPAGVHVRVDELVTALRNSKRYGVYFQKVNRYGLSRTISRWLRTGAFRNHVLVSGVGICNTFDCAERKTMELRFNIPKRMQESLGKV